MRAAALPSRAEASAHPEAAAVAAPVALGGLWPTDIAATHDAAPSPPLLLLLGAGLESKKTDEAYRRMMEIVAELASDGPTEEEVERARAYAGGRRVLSFEDTNSVASFAAGRAIVHGEGFDPDEAIALIDAVSHEDVARVARLVDPERLAVACVGPHEASEFA